MANILIKKVPQRKKEEVHVKKEIQPVPRKEATIEAEALEIIVGDFDFSGLPSLFTIGGQPHSNGGTPLNPPDNSFIFSKDKSMKIKDEAVLKDFRKNPKHSGEVPAALAKQYDINYYRKILADPDSDKIQIDSATHQITNYNEKIGKLSLIQESMKGMPDGIPYVAIPYLASMGIDPASLVHGSAGAPEVSSQGDEDYQSMGKGGGIDRDSLFAGMSFATHANQPDYLRGILKTAVENPDTDAGIKMLQGYEAAEKKYKTHVNLTNDQVLKIADEGIEDKVFSTLSKYDQERILKAKKYKFGGHLQKAKKGKEPKKEFVYTPKQIENMQKARELGYNLQGPIDSIEEDAGLVDAVQKKLPNNVYGRRDWTQPKYYDDFKKRADWYLKDNPTFNPQEPSDVAAFQGAYNKRMMGMGLGAELDEDSKFGERTYSIYDLNNINKPEAPIVTPEQKKIIKNTADIPVKHLVNQPNAPGAAPDFWTEDKVRMAGAFGDFARIKKYQPWQAQPELYLPSATYYDPTRELAANSEQANQAESMLSTYSNVQGASARFGEVQGKALENAANILGKYNNMNVEIANNSAANNAAALTQFSQNKANNATALYDKTVIANQQFNNAKTQARANMRDSFINAWSNRGKTQALNSMNKQYNVDPSTGFVNFTGVPGQISPETPQDFVSTYQSVLQQLGIGKDDKEGRKEALRIASQMHGMHSEGKGQVPYDAYNK